MELELEENFQPNYEYEDSVPDQNNLKGMQSDANINLNSVLAKNDALVLACDKDIKLSTLTTHIPLQRHISMLCDKVICHLDQNLAAFEPAKSEKAKILKIQKCKRQFKELFGDDEDADYILHLNKKNRMI